MTWNGYIRADARHLPIADSCVQCVVTSPPYWGLRDYGNSEQIGLEKTPREYLNNIRAVAFEVWRVLRADGTFWLNLGDSYAGSWGAQSRENPGPQGTSTLGGGSPLSARQILAHPKQTQTGSLKNTPGLKPKDLVGIPWRVAFALQEDGWYLRRDIVWHKPNPMPESVTDRCTSSHEYIFMLTKSARYYYDAESVKEPGSLSIAARLDRAQNGYAPPGQTAHRGTALAPRENRTDKQRGHSRRHDGFNARWDAMPKDEQCAMPRNRRSVWTIATSSYPEAHYATFPEEIPEICIKAGSRPGDLILDPFFGSGTVGRVAERLSRRWIGCDLSYQDLQEKRMRNLQRELIHDHF